MRTHAISTRGAVNRRERIVLWIGMFERKRPADNLKQAEHALAHFLSFSIRKSFAELLLIDGFEFLDGLPAELHGGLYSAYRML